VSKASRKKARKHKSHKRVMSVICQRCGVLEGASAGDLLTRVADAMNACTDAGLEIRVRHGALIARKGYVLPLASGSWSARTLAYDPFVQVPVLPDDLDD
jgi:hypothetical protein